MPTIPTINPTPKRYMNQDVKIPFYIDRDRLYRLKLKVSKNKREDIDFLREEAKKYYITYYFPEFYTFLHDLSQFEGMLPENTTIDEVEDIVNEVQSSVQLESFFSVANPNKSLVVLNTYYDFAAIRKQWIEEDKMPSFEDNAAFFREKNEFSNTNSQTILTIGTLLQDNNLLNNGLRAFDTQQRDFEGQLNINVNFTSLQNSTLMILNMIVQQLMHQIKQTAPGVRITDADTMTIQFGSGDRGQAVVTGIEYLIVEESIESQHLKVGEFSYALYHRSFKDPLSLAVLKDYRNIINGVQSLAIGGNGGYSATAGFNFMDFLNNPETMQSLGNEFNLLVQASGSLVLNVDTEPQKAMQAEFLKVAAEFGLINISDTRELEKGFTESFTTEEINKLKAQVANNPAIYRKVAARQKTRALKNAIEITSVIDDVMNKGPLGLMDRTAAGRTISKVFRTLGLDALAKEIVICLTAGLNIETSRITQAVRNSLTAILARNYYKKPKPPKTIVIPKIDESMFKPRLKDGNVSEIILGVLVDTLQEVALEAIKQLVNLIRETCPLTNPRTTDYGANNLEDYLRPDPGANLASPRGDQMDRISEKNNLTPSQLRQYLRGISVILSSVDMCNLFVSQENVTGELIDRILDFNEEYALDKVSEYLNTESSIMGFFLDVAAIVDVTELCETIANEVYQLNSDDICLILDTNLDDLLEVIENGLQIEYPTINFDCPDSANFVNDPTLTKAIPELFSTIAESVELQFINSAEAIKEILLEPDLKNTDDSDVMARLNRVAEMGRQTEATGSLQGINKEILNTIRSAITTIAATGQSIEDSCDPPPSQILGLDIAGLLSTGVDVMGEIAGAVNDPAFQESLSNIGTRLDGLGDNGPGISSPIVQTYDFNRQFLNHFSNYIDASQYAYTATPESYPLTVERNFYALRIPPQPPVDLDASLAALMAGETQTSLVLEEEFPPGPQPGDYYSECIKFNFPSPATPLIQVENQDYLRIRYPREELDNPRIVIDFRSTVIDTQFSDSLASVDAVYLDDFSDYTTDRAANPYIDQFVDAYRAAAAESGLAFTNADAIEAETFRFPQAYSALVDGMFKYVLDNGIFTAAKLQAMNFFYVNENCPPNEVSDLLDVNGILDAMSAEYREQACNTPVLKDRETGRPLQGLTIRDKVRNIVKYGLYLLLIQIHVAEFILKNIFVFSAFPIDSLLGNTDGFLFKYFKTQVTQSIVKFLDTAKLRGTMFSELDKDKVEENLVAYFNAKIQRKSIRETGGIRYSQAPQNVAFPAGTLFTMNEHLLSLTGSSAGPTPPQSFDHIIEYLLAERLHSSRFPINNTIRRARRNNSVLPMNLALLSTYPVLEITNEIAPTIAEVTVAANVIFAQQPTVFVVKRFTAVGILYSLWFYDAGEAPAVVDDTSPYDPQSLQEVAALLTDTDNDGIPDAVDADVDGDGILDSVAGAQAVPLIQDLYTGALGDHFADSVPTTGAPSYQNLWVSPDDGSLAFQEELGVDNETIAEVQALSRETTLAETINDDTLVDPDAMTSVLVGIAGTNSLVYGTVGGAEMVQDAIVQIDAAMGQLSNLGFDIPGMVGLLDLSAIGANPAGALDFLNSLDASGGQGGNDPDSGNEPMDNSSDSGDSGGGSGGSSDDDDSEIETYTNEETGLTAVRFTDDDDDIWAGPFGDGEGGLNLSGRGQPDTEMFGSSTPDANINAGAITPEEGVNAFSGMASGLTVQGLAVLQGMASGLKDYLQGIE